MSREQALACYAAEMTRDREAYLYQHALNKARVITRSMGPAEREEYLKSEAFAAVLRLVGGMDEKQAAAQHPEEPTFRAVAESWEGQHREEITDRTWKNYKPHYEDLLDRYGDYFNGLIRSGIDPEVARGIIDRLTTQQSIMLATNTVMQACAVVLVIAAFSIWFGPNTNRIRAELARRSTQKS